MEAIANWIFPGLALYYRDTPLTAQQLALYQIGHIIRNDFFIDCSPILGGLIGNTRYLIASSKTAAIYTVSPDVRRFKQHTINANAFFKILDIYHTTGKTQVLLLHIPRAYSLVLNPQSTFKPLEPQVVQTARVRFDQAIGMPPDPNLADIAWQKKVGLPIGITPDNQLNDIHSLTPLPPESRQLSEAFEKMVNDTSDLNK